MTYNTQGVDRITSVYTKLAGSTLDEGQKLAALKPITPVDFYKHITIAAINKLQAARRVSTVCGSGIREGEGLRHDSSRRT